MRTLLGILALAAIGSAACSDSSAPPDPSPGALLVSVSTQGDEADPDGYLLKVDSLPNVTLEANGTVTIPLSVGRHDVRLSGVAEPCAVVSKAFLQVPVSSGDTAQAAFQVDCTLGSVHAVITTTGLDPDPDGYLMKLDADDSLAVNSIPFGPSDTATFSRLAPGVHTISLSGAAQHCSVQGPESKDVTVVSGEIAQIEFTVECGASYGVIAFSVTTSGDDVGGLFGGLYVALNASTTRLWPGMKVYATATIGNNLVRVISTALNCSAVGDYPRTVNVASGLTRDTVEVVFAMHCVSLPIVRVTAPTTGANPDDSYRVIESVRDVEFGVYVDTSLTLPANGTAAFKRPYPGDYQLKLLDVASNCTVTVANPTQFFQITFGDTLDVEFPVTCSP